MGLFGLLGRVLFPGCVQQVCVQKAQRNELATDWRKLAHSPVLVLMLKESSFSPQETPTN